MKPSIFWLAATLISSYTVSAQVKFPGDPFRAQFVTSDIKNFWTAFDTLQAGYKPNPFAKFYINAGSPGVAGFMDGRIEHPDSLLNYVNSHKPEYVAQRANTFKMLDKEQQCRAAFYALKHWYPQATFPPVYFVVGRFNSGGTSKESGLIIGAERVNADGVPFIVAHELIHFQQPIPKSDPNLLTQCIREGSADFLGELISGVNTNQGVFAYGDAHETALWREFKTRISASDYVDWLYTTSGKDKRPNDLGYWIGYKITKAYFDKATDKRKAVDEIVHVTDGQTFLQQSGYANKFK